MPQAVLWFPDDCNVAGLPAGLPCWSAHMCQAQPSSLQRASCGVESGARSQAAVSSALALLHPFALRPSCAGKDLNRKELNDGFSSCMADAAEEEAAAANGGSA